MPLTPDFTKTYNYAKEQFRKTLPRVYEVKRGRLWGLDRSQSWHTAKPELPLGMEELVVWSKDNMGEIPRLWDGKSRDIPTVDVEIGSKSYKAAMYALKMDWNMIQMEKHRNAEINNQTIPSLNLMTAKQDAVADFFNRGEHKTVLYGHQIVGIRGLFSQSGIATTDTSFKPYVKASGSYTLTTRQLYNDMKDIIMMAKKKFLVTSVSMVEMKVPSKLYERLLEIYNDTSGLTVLQMLKSSEIGMGINIVQDHDELHGAELNKNVLNDTLTGYLPANRDRIVLKASDFNPERYYYNRRPLPDFQISVVDYEKVFMSATTGLILTDETQMMYYDFDNAVA